MTPLARLTQAITAQIFGPPVQVQFAGAAPLMSSGVFQVNIVIPADLPTTGIPVWSVDLVVGGVLSTGAVTIAVQ